LNNEANTKGKIALQRDKMTERPKKWLVIAGVLAALYIMKDRDYFI